MKNLECRIQSNHVIAAKRWYSKLSDEFIAKAVDGLDVLGMFGVCFEFLAEPGDVDVDGAGRGHCVVTPNVVEQLVARMDRAAVFDQKLQEFEFHRGKVDVLFVLERFGAFEIDRDVAEAK